MSYIVSVVVNKLTRSVDRFFDYVADKELYNKLKIGHMVFVPFGRGDSVIEAFVVAFPETTDCTNLKKIISIANDEPMFDEELLSIACFMKEKYFSTYISAIKTISPPGIGMHFDKINEKVIKGVELDVSYEDAYSFLESIRDKAPMQARVLELLIQNDFVSYTDIMMISGCSRAVIKALESKKIITQTEVAVFRNPIDYNNIVPSNPHIPNEEQESAINTISESKSLYLHCGQI